MRLNAHPPWWLLFVIYGVAGLFLAINDGLSYPETINWQRWWVVMVSSIGMLVIGAVLRSYRVTSTHVPWSFRLLVTTFVTALVAIIWRWS